MPFWFWCWVFGMLWLNVGVKFIRKIEKAGVLTFNLRVAHALDDRGWSRFALAVPVLFVWIIEGALWPMVYLLRGRYYCRMAPPRAFFVIRPREKEKRYMN